MEIRSYLGKKVIIEAEAFKDDGALSGEVQHYPLEVENCGNAQFVERLRRAGEIPMYDRGYGKVLTVPVMAQLSPDVNGMPRPEEDVIFIVPASIARHSFRHDVYIVHEVVEETDEYVKCRGLMIP